MSLKPVFNAQRRRSTIVIMKREKDKGKEVVLYPLIPFEDQPVCCHKYHEPFQVDQMKKCIKSSPGVHMIRSIYQIHELSHGVRLRHTRFIPPNQIGCL